MALCSCSTGKGNTGRPNCFPIFDVTKKVIFLDYFKDDGTVNGIDLTALTGGIFTQTDLDALTQNLDPNLRWYASPLIKQVVNERGDNITEDFDDGSTIFIQKGARTFTGIVTKGDPKFSGAIESMRCSTLGVFYIDKTGNLIGKQTRDGFLDPILLENETIDGNYVMPTDTTGSKVGISFGVSTSEDDTDMIMLTADTITADLLGARGLVDAINTSTTTQSTTELFFHLDTPYGGATSRIAASGLVLADFTFTNLTTALAVVPSGVVENPADSGNYEATYAAQTASDVMEVKSAVLDKGFEITPFTEILS